jgi:tRNA uridine 5-carbamoylmethylation protein Kti12
LIANDLPAIRSAIAVLDKILVSKTWNDASRQVVQAAGDELAGLAIAQPSRYLKSLNAMRYLLDKSVLEASDQQMIIALKASLSSALEQNSAKPLPSQRSDDELSRQFIKALTVPNP